MLAEIVWTPGAIGMATDVLANGTGRRDGKVGLSVHMPQRREI